MDLEGSDRGRVRGPRLSSADNDQDVPIDLCWAGSHHQPVCVCVCACARKSVSMSTCLCVCAQECEHVYLCVSVCECVCVPHPTNEKQTKLWPFRRLGAVLGF